MKHLFTILTPTYNRAHLLHRPYKSLLKQTFKDFEWLIVDDGSTDDTESVVRQWMQSPETWFPIRYIKQKHGHKKVAVNRGVKEAKGELILVLDSDDELLPNALERLSFHWFNIPEQERNKFGGVVGLCVDDEGNLVGQPLLSFYIDASPQELVYKYKIRQEMVGFVRTDILKKFPFPEDITGLVPESVVWGAIGEHYKFRFVNEVFRVYHSENDQITRTSKPGKDCEGHLYYRYLALSRDIKWFRYHPLIFLVRAAQLVRFWLHCSPERRRWFWPESLFGKFLVVIMFPAGVLWWMRDKWVYRG